MICEKQIKIGLKVVFILLQTVIGLSGLFTGIFVGTIYSRLKGFLLIPLRAVVPLLALASFGLINGLIGYTCLASKRKTRLFFFVLTMAALLNLQLLLSFNSNRLLVGNKDWLNRNWMSFSDTQKSVVEDHLECCGLETTLDRSSHGCQHQISCMSKARSIGFAMHAIVQKTVLLLFFIETLSLCVLACLRFCS
ncbi:hypothetical protein PAPHI01_1079 [Pancytospora philotis]|nr:hypothetical protein PAPHI01_1079 [Pancytospora philotis]